MEYKYLVMVTAQNNNKYYEMIPQGDSFTVKYGRVGASAQVASYPASSFDKKYNEKIKKGYVDQTDIRKDLISNRESEEKHSIYKEIENDSVRNLIDFLQKVARQKIDDNYNISSNKVTQAMIDEAQLALNKLAVVLNKKQFNEILLDLFNILPRKMSNVSYYLAESDSQEEFSKIYTREQELLNVMKGQVIQHNVDTKIEETSNDSEEAQKTILEVLGLEIQPANKTDEKIIKKELGDLRDKYYSAWKVHNKMTRDRFDKHIAESDFRNTKLLWHGSRNENWMSIISNGLLLNPNAVITGKMFGKGIYYALQPRKSFNYTSYNNSYWAHGDSDVAFMGLYQVHYGNPYIVSNFDSKYYDFDYNRLTQEGNFNCLHADSSKGMLRNDEIVIYKEDQADIEYLVELK